MEVPAAHPNPAQAPQQPRAAKPPWTLRLGSLCWIIAGLSLALTPLIAALLIRSQYLSLRRNGYIIAELADRLDPADAVELEPYIAEFERIEALVLSAPGWVIGLAIVTYVLTALVTLAGYLTISLASARGVDWTRYAGSALAFVSSIIVFQLWQLFAAIAWMPITALLTNHLGLVAIALQVTGAVLVFLPPSNTYVRERRARIRLRRAEQLVASSIGRTS